MKTTKHGNKISGSTELIKQDVQSIKKFSLIVVLVGLVVGLTFTMAQLNFGAFTAIIATLLASMTAIVIKIMEKYFGTTEYPTTVGK